MKRQHGRADESRDPAMPVPVRPYDAPHGRAPALDLAPGARGRDAFGHRSEFVSPVRSAKSLG